MATYPHFPSTVEWQKHVSRHQSFTHDQLMISISIDASVWPGGRLPFRCSWRPKITIRFDSSAVLSDRVRRAFYLLFHFLSDIYRLQRLWTVCFAVLLGMAFFERFICCAPCHHIRPDQCFRLSPLLRRGTFFQFVEINYLDIFCKVSVLFISWALLWWSVPHSFLSKHAPAGQTALHRSEKTLELLRKPSFALRNVFLPHFWAIFYFVVRQTHKTDEKRRNRAKDYFRLLNLGLEEYC